MKVAVKVLVDERAAAAEAAVAIAMAKAALAAQVKLLAITETVKTTVYAVAVMAKRGAALAATAAAAMMPQAEVLRTSLMLAHTNSSCAGLSCAGLLLSLPLPPGSKNLTDMAAVAA